MKNVQNKIHASQPEFKEVLTSKSKLEEVAKKRQKGTQVLGSQGASRLLDAIRDVK